MKRPFLALFTAPCVVLSRKTIFYKVDKKIVVEAPGSLIRQLVETCDGTRSIEEVIQLLKDEWEERSICDLIRKLCQYKVLVDSRYLCDVVWKAVENPSQFPSLITDSEVALLVEQARNRHRSQSSDKVYQASPFSLGRFLDRRRSVRSFSGQPIELQSIVDMLWSAYGEVHTLKDDSTLTTNCRRTVPSAGALYPLMIHVALFKDMGELHPGIYSAWMGLPGTVGFKLVSKDTDRFIRAFTDPLVLDGAHGVIVVSGSFHATSKKYGNRSMLYVTLEAGHAAQNVHLAATESEVATVEIGGFVEELLAETIKLSKYYCPLTTIVFGHGERATEANTSKKEIKVHWAVPMANQYRLPFTMAFARVSSNFDRSWSGGKAISPALAHNKAVAEAKEWAACGCIPNTLIRAQLTDLKTAVDPREIVKFHSAQYSLKGFPFKPFNEKVAYAWVEGKDELQGSKAHILADCVYFPYYPKTPRYTQANSSGVAAYPEREQAIKNGVLELVERDSFMIAYLAKLPLPTISEKSLPQSIRKRIESLRKNGFKVWVKDHTLDLAPVVFMFVQNKEITFTTCAGCSNFDVEVALSHALMEVESMVWSRLKNGPPKTLVKPSDVHFTKDHAGLYVQKQFFQKADFLVTRSVGPVTFQEVGQRVARSWQALLDRFVVKGWSLITVPLHLTEEFGGNDNLHIIRSIVPGMVPMSFGYRKEPCGMERIHLVAKEITGVPISYRDMSKFPHPFP